MILSLKNSAFYFRFGIFACAIWFLIDKDKSILNLFYYALIISFSILSIDSYAQFFYDNNLFGIARTEVDGRVPSMFGKELILGSYLSRFFPILFALFIIKEKKNKFEIYYIGILFIIIDILIFISGERTAFFFLNLSTLFIILFIKKYQKFRLITFVIALILCTLLTLSNSSVKKRMISSPIESMGLSSKTDTKYLFTKSHDSKIKTALNMFLDKPLFGHGPKMFRVKCSDPRYATGYDPCSTHPHNFYIQLLAETGIIGFSFLFGLFCYVIFCSYKQFKSIIFNQKRYLSDYQVCLLAAILITSWPFSPNGNFFTNWLAITYSLPFGFYLQSVYKKK